MPNVAVKRKKLCLERRGCWAPAPGRGLSERLKESLYGQARNVSMKCE